MKDLNLALKVLESLEGLEVALNIGIGPQDSTLTVTGHFTKIVDALAILVARDEEYAVIRRKLENLQQKS